MTTPQPAEFPVSVGQKFLGKYEIQKHLGQGGMGTVFEARHLLTEARWAIKFLLSGRLKEAEKIAEFHKEARLISRVNHPNVVKVVDFDIVQTSGTDTPAQLAYMVMELLEGVDLGRVLRSAKEGKTPVPRPLEITRFLILARQILTALDAIHAAGIIHRDLKPANIMVIDPQTPHEFIKICDFGIATIVDEVTEGREVKGTPLYMCPELIRGQKVDHRSDLYSLGVIFFEMLTGGRLIASSNHNDIFRFHLEQAPPPIRNPGVPPRLEKFVLRALAKNPSDRWATTGEMLREIDLIFSTTAIVFGDGFDVDRLVAGLASTPEVTEPSTGQDALQPRLVTLKPGYNPKSSRTVTPKNVPQWISIGIFVLILTILAVIALSAFLF